MNWSSDDSRNTEAPEQESPAAPEAEAEAQAPDPTDELKQRIKQLEGAVREAQQDVLRAQAEAQTVLRRQRAMWEEEKKYAVRDLVEELLPVLDNFERSMAALEKGASPEKVRDGISQVEKLLRQALLNAGLKPVPAEGHLLDPHLHEAIATETNEELPEETVTAVLEPGYQLHDRVLRPAKVRVSVKA